MGLALENGFDTSRHTLGVVGYGNIGTIVADWGRKLGARVIICDPPRKKAALPTKNISRSKPSFAKPTP